MQPCCSHHIIETIVQSVPILSVALLALMRYFKRLDQSVLVKAFKKPKVAK